MDDEVLARARALVQAMNAMSMPAQSLAVPTPIPVSDPVKVQSLNVDTGSGNIKAAAIKGSTLVTTFTDIRPLVQRGATIFIDGVECKISTGGEWSGGRIELTSDYAGETNFDAVITFAQSKKKSKKAEKKSPTPIAPNIIMKAVEDLDAFNSHIKSVG